jgi:hypothetical protein
VTKRSVFTSQFVDCDGPHAVDHKPLSCETLRVALDGQSGNMPIIWARKLCIKK